MAVRQQKAFVLGFGLVLASPVCNVLEGSSPLLSQITALH